jgi:hypothetical protein
VVEQAHRNRRAMSLDLGRMSAVELQADTIEEMDNPGKHLNTVRIRAHRLGVVLRDRSVMLRLVVLASLGVKGPRLATYLFCWLYP